MIDLIRIWIKVWKDQNNYQRIILIGRVMQKVGEAQIIKEIKY
jgi:hypothetical protein